MAIAIIELPDRIQTLLEQRKHHSDAIVQIDATLANVNTALGVKPPAKRGRKPGTKAATSPKATPAPKTGKRRRRSKFAVSGGESVLAFIRSKENPTTRDIKQNWISEGRAGGVDNTLSILAKDKKITRTPLGKGIRGSRYTIAQ